MEKTMKALAIDSATPVMTVAAMNGDSIVSASYDMGMRQSEMILPGVEYILSTAGIKSQELDFTAICSGPGSFTGLRLGFSVLKAIEAAAGIPIYGIPTLHIYAEPFLQAGCPVIPAIDAKKDRFYSCAYMDGELTAEDGDYSAEEIMQFTSGHRNILVCGPDSGLLKGRLASMTPEMNIMDMGGGGQLNSGKTLLLKGRSLFESGAAPLRDFDGPDYMRASEAEIKLHAPHK